MKDKPSTRTSLKDKLQIPAQDTEHLQVAATNTRLDIKIRRTGLWEEKLTCTNVMLHLEEETNLFIIYND